MYPKYYEDKNYDDSFYFRFNINDIAEPHFHHNTELLFVKDGKMEITINGVKKILTKGMIAISNSFDVHKYETIDYSESYVMIVGERYCWKFYSSENNCFDNYLEPCSVTEKIFAMLQEFSVEKENYNELMSIGFCNYLLGVLSKTYGLVKRKKTVTDNFIVKALTYINENISTDMTLDSISKEMGYSKSQFSVIFNKYTGLHLKEYINNIRYHNVRNMVEKQNITLTQAVYLCGFSSVETYYKTQKRIKDAKNQYDIR